MFDQFFHDFEMFTFCYDFHEQVLETADIVALLSLSLSAVKEPQRKALIKRLCVCQQSETPGQIVPAEALLHLGMTMLVLWPVCGTTWVGCLVSGRQRSVCLQDVCGLRHEQTLMHRLWCEHVRKLQARPRLSQAIVANRVSDVVGFNCPLPTN